MNHKLITVVVILLLLLIFILQNQTSVPIKFLFFSGQTSAALILLVAFLLGLASGIILMLFKKR